MSLAISSTPGRTWQAPQRRSSPNQATTRVTCSTFGQLGLELVQGHHDVGPAVGVVDVRRHGLVIVSRLNTVSVA